MNRSVSIFLAVLMLSLTTIMFIMVPGCAKSSGKNDNEIKPPKAQKIKKELTLHSHTRIDNYFWLNQRQNPEVIDYLKAENAYLEKVMKHTEGLQTKVFNEITARLKQEDLSVPFHENGYYYYHRYEKGREYPIYCRKKDNPDHKEEILMDVNQMAKGHDFYEVQESFGVSPNGTLLAYGVDTVSRRRYTISVKNLVTGEMLPEEIPDTSGDVVWANDNKTFFYLAKDDTLRAYKIFAHRLGTPVSKDREVFHEKDETFILYSLSRTASKKYIIAESHHTIATEYLYIDADKPEDFFRPVIPRQRHFEYTVDHHDNRWIIKTNDNAKNFRLMEAPTDRPVRQSWKEIIPHRQGVFLEAFRVFKDFLVLQERKNGLPGIRILSWDQKTSANISFKDPTYMVELSFHQRYDSSKLRYVYNSLTTPQCVYEYDMVKREPSLLKQDYVGGGFVPGTYTSQLLWATARDGVKIPVSLVYKKGLKKNGKNPLFLYAYGSYGYNVEVKFYPQVLSLLDRGFVYAVAHIRGGQEMGRHWYENGKLLNKINTFTDFIDCARFLVNEKYTDPAKLFANGGSAGGLLMGAIATMEPKLFKGVIADVPFLDVVTTMLDKSIPLTTSEFDEWGNPELKKYYDYMLSYSPYDQVKAQTYPALLVTAGLHDSQVQYWEPAKWVAKLREIKTGDNILLLHTNMAGGHSGSSGRFRKYKETALAYAFVLDLLGMKK